MAAADVIFKTIKTYRGTYLYDRHTASIVAVTQCEYDELKRVEEGKCISSLSHVIKRYQSLGFLGPNVVEMIKHPKTEILEHHAEFGLKMITLQVTQQCNLRCEYCVYSGIYENNRQHSNQTMSFENAKKALDFYIQHSRDVTDCSVGFYGGEPLLAFSLIKKCVEYLENQIEGKNLIFNITTNGTLLKGDILDYIVKKNIHISISLDGNKEEHDRNRKFINGEGTFDTIIGNITDAKKRYPDYVNNINIMATVNPHMNLACVMDFFKVNEVLRDNNIVFNEMNQADLKNELDYENVYYCIRNFEYLKMLLSLVGKIDKKTVSPLMLKDREKTEIKKEELHRHKPLQAYYHHAGPCMPGIMRLFVRTDGAYFPCERVSDNLEYFKIGSIDAGFNIERMREILNIGTLTQEECKSCWCLRECSMCAGQIETRGNDRPTKQAKLDYCKRCRMSNYFYLYEQCVLNEFGYKKDSVV